jgi:hypothetical protein
VQQQGRPVYVTRAGRQAGRQARERGICVRVKK